MGRLLAIPATPKPASCISPTPLRANHNREAVSAYLDVHREYCRISREEYEKNPPPVVHRLRRIAQELDGYPSEERQAALQRILEREKAATTKTTQAA